MRFWVKMRTIYEVFKKKSCVYLTERYVNLVITHKESITILYAFLNKMKILYLKVHLPMFSFSSSPFLLHTLGSQSPIRFKYSSTEINSLFLLSLRDWISYVVMVCLEERDQGKIFAWRKIKLFATQSSTHLEKT